MPALERQQKAGTVGLSTVAILAFVLITLPVVTVMVAVVLLVMGIWSF